VTPTLRTCSPRSRAASTSSCGRSRLTARPRTEGRRQRGAGLTVYPDPVTDRQEVAR
jgi:hypothetical protein